MPNGRKRAVRARKERNALLALDHLYHPSAESVTFDQLPSIRFTHLRIHPTFGNTKHMTVFEVYFAVKYNFMDLSRLPPIRVFRHEGHLWSVDNRRLWVMRQVNDWHIEGPYIERQSPIRFQEFTMKHRGLNGTSGEDVTFHRDAPHECCIDAWKSGSLDEHIAVIHLNMTLDEVKLLSRCILHKEKCDCIYDEESNCRTLSGMINARKRRLNQIKQTNTETIDKILQEE
ncbi:unnamed protein product [Rotaria socialis]|uniref:Uncharacterized protein n=1 Tax=Rotaria socialis TaxID=392032 RepID=A0A820KNT6_9BILA|nr:unnamed protein product [Rotaria socialis]CAF3489574.1 unnamed protein product [Rotaria socialis]CAF4344325.1 unnamed protein product [Rotaria socialis]